MGIFKRKLNLATLCDFYYKRVLTNDRQYDLIVNSLPESEITDEGLQNITQNQELYNIVTFNISLISFSFDGTIKIDPHYLKPRLFDELNKTINKLGLSDNKKYELMLLNIKEDIDSLSLNLSSSNQNADFLDEIITYLISKYNVEKEFETEENIFIRLSSITAFKASLNNATKHKIVI